MTRLNDWRGRKPPGPRARSAEPLDARSLRTVWIRAIAAAGAVGEATGNRTIFDLRHDLATVAGRLFPVEGESPQAAARAFIELGKAFCIAATPERRGLLAPAFRATAKALDDLITEVRTREAKGTWYGQRDD